MGALKRRLSLPQRALRVLRRKLPDASLGWGAFGENLTTEGLLESTVRTGDQLRIGTTELVVTQPRMPCYTIDDDSRELLQRAVKTAALPQGWRDHFQTRLWEADS